ncbi:hypothetical protein ROZALSC1DRAFT_28416 [Rozella allomycis CSF55]|uniref:DDE Tnp4 domain-containing protein n=1 Tax=Rozella allomycis (strain CSF55) TaxID=988480 RepID=A0A075AZ96_ROZAC|nr:hypothetical protein O9G_005006 [Rozella allomycis CSF55]RKP20054.1 hypothetical protein ROZALSC1DRAFT_28416 [Rozella allomycis CSF55]|eukprot:EPZ35469.1 hypothetical protein O9G_005006 [Rozella allomycis CSF55]
MALRKAINMIPEAAIRWPTLQEQYLWASKVTAKEPLVGNKWGFVDGKNFRVEKPADANTQNAMYNGWLHQTLVTGTICFGADGTIVWAKHNCPGSWNDGDTSRALQNKLSDPRFSPDPNMGILSDSAFPVLGAVKGKIVTPLKDGDLGRIHPSCRSAATAMSNAITSLRQAAEWGMGAIEKPFERLLMKLPSNKFRRSIRLSNIFRLYNIRVRRTGISQI